MLFVICGPSRRTYMINLSLASYPHMIGDMFFSRRRCLFLKFQRVILRRCLCLSARLPSAHTGPPEKLRKIKAKIGKISLSRTAGKKKRLCKFTASNPNSRLEQRQAVVSVYPMTLKSPRTSRKLWMCFGKFFESKSNQMVSWKVWAFLAPNQLRKLFKHH